MVRADETVSIAGRNPEGYGSAILSSAFGLGGGGDVVLEATSLQVSDGALVSSQSSGAGNAGNIRIWTGDAVTVRDASVTTSSGQADGGNIRLDAERLVRLIDSTVSASVGGGPETDGGNIGVGSEYVVLEGSRVLANAYEGKGGSIQIAAQVCLIDGNSTVDASSTLGIDGEVDIRAPIKEISGSLAPLQENFKRSMILLREPCMARMLGGGYSSFHVVGREALPLEPGGLLASPLP